MVDVKKVKEIWKELQELSNSHNYREFEVAYLIAERLDNVIGSEDDITENVVKAVYDVTSRVDTLLDDYVNEEMDIIGHSFEESEVDE